MDTTFTDALREAADWFDAHPDVPRPLLTPRLSVMVADADNVPALVRRLTGFRKYDFGSILTLSRLFGVEEAGVRIDFDFTRAQVCERKVVGVKVVPATIVPEHEEEIVQWECLPLLAERGEA